MSTKCSVVRQTANEHLDQTIVISTSSKSPIPMLRCCSAKYRKWKCIHAENSTMKSIALLKTFYVQCTNSDGMALESAWIDIFSKYGIYEKKG